MVTRLFFILFLESLLPAEHAAYNLSESWAGAHCELVATHICCFLPIYPWQPRFSEENEPAGSSRVHLGTQVQRGWPRFWSMPKEEPSCWRWNSEQGLVAVCVVPGGFASVCGLVFSFVCCLCL